MPQVTSAAPERIAPTVLKPSVSERPFCRIGQPEAAHRPVIVHNRAWQEIRRHLATDLTVELGGVLVGELRAWDGREYVEIHAAVAAATANQSPVHFAFTAETWVTLIDLVEEQFPDQYMVGWYHSHPRMGVFFSGQDADVHRIVFNQPWHVALVVDPVGDESGFFGWVDAKPWRLPGFYLVRDAEAAERRPRSQVPADRPSRKAQRSKPGPASPLPASPLSLATAAKAWMTAEIGRLGTGLNALRRGQRRHAAEPAQFDAPMRTTTGTVAPDQPAVYCAGLVVKVAGAGLGAGATVPSDSTLTFEWEIVNASAGPVSIAALGLRVFLAGVERPDVFVTPHNLPLQPIKLEPRASHAAQGSLVAGRPGSYQIAASVLMAGAPAWEDLAREDGTPAAPGFQVVSPLPAARHQ